MASSSTSGTVGQLTKPEYRNWLALGHALTTEMCQGLRPFITREIKTFYTSVSVRTGGRPCACVRVPRRKPNEFHDMSTCAWANILQAHHNRNKPNWKQSDPTKWMDPNQGPWEMAKLFLPDLGGHADIKSADDMDITGILNLMYWCNIFTVSQALINEVRETRNTKWVHVPKLELKDADKKTAFDAIENLLNDPQLARNPDAQKARQEIVTLKYVSDLHNVEAQVQAQFKDAISTLSEESRNNKEQQNRSEGRLNNVEKALENLEDKMKASITFTDVIPNGVSYLWNNVIKFTVTDVMSYLWNYVIKYSGGTRRTLLTPWLVILLLCGCFTILDPRSYKDGKL